MGLAPWRSTASARKVLIRVLIFAVCLGLAFVGFMGLAAVVWCLKMISVGSLAFWDSPYSQEGYRF